MGVEQLYLIIGFLLGVLLTGCIFTIGIVLYHEWAEKPKKEED